VHVFKAFREGCTQVLTAINRKQTLYFQTRSKENSLSVHAPWTSVRIEGIREA
jgi:hypothetical protein